MSQKLFGLTGADASRLKTVMQSVEGAMSSGGFTGAEKAALASAGGRFPTYPMGGQYPFGLNFAPNASAYSLLVMKGVLHIAGTTPFEVPARQFNLFPLKTEQCYHIVYDTREYTNAPNIARMRIVAANSLTDFSSRQWNSTANTVCFLVEVGTNNIFDANTAISSDKDTALAARDIAEWDDLILMYSVSLTGAKLNTVRRHDFSYSASNEYEAVRAIAIIDNEDITKTNKQIVLEGDRADQQVPGVNTGIYIRSDDANLVKIPGENAYKFVPFGGSLELRGTTDSSDPENEEYTQFQLVNDLETSVNASRLTSGSANHIRFYGLLKQEGASNSEISSIADGQVGWHNLIFEGAIGRDTLSVVADGVPISLKSEIIEADQEQISTDLVYTYRNGAYGWTVPSVPVGGIPLLAGVDSVTKYIDAGVHTFTLRNDLSENALREKLVVIDDFVEGTSSGLIVYGFGGNTIFDTIKGWFSIAANEGVRIDRPSISQSIFNITLEEGLTQDVYDAATTKYVYAVVPINGVNTYGFIVPEATVEIPEGINSVEKTTIQVGGIDTPVYELVNDQTDAQLAALGIPTDGTPYICCYGHGETTRGWDLTVFGTMFCYGDGKLVLQGDTVSAPTAFFCKDAAGNYGFGVPEDTGQEYIFSEEFEPLDELNNVYLNSSHITAPFYLFGAGAFGAGVSYGYCTVKDMIQGVNSIVIDEGAITNSQVTAQLVGDIDFTEKYGVGHTFAQSFGTPGTPGYGMLFYGYGADGGGYYTMRFKDGVVFAGGPRPGEDNFISLSSTDVTTGYGTGTAKAVFAKYTSGATTLYGWLTPSFAELETVSPATATTVKDGTASNGTGTKAARNNHVHPLNADTTLPSAVGPANVAGGTLKTYAYVDHVHADKVPDFLGDGSLTILLSTNEGAAAANGSTWAAGGATGLRLSVVTRTRYHEGDTTPAIVNFYRNLTFDTKGRLAAISSEGSYVVDVPVVLTVT